MDCVQYYVKVEWKAKLFTIPIPVDMDAAIYLEICADGTTSSDIVYHIGWEAYGWEATER